MQLIYKMLFLSIFFISSPLLQATKENSGKAKQIAQARIKNTYPVVKEDAPQEDQDYKLAAREQLLAHYNIFLASTELGTPRRIRFISCNAIAKVFKTSPRYAILLRMLKQDLQKEFLTAAQERLLLDLILQYDDAYALIALLGISTKNHALFLDENLHSDSAPRCFSLWRCAPAFDSALNCFKQAGLIE